MVFEKLVVKASSADEEEDLVDPQDVLKEKCGKGGKCVPFQDILQQCTEKVNAGKGLEGETCSEELFNFLHCVDHCVAKTLFNHLK